MKLLHQRLSDDNQSTLGILYKESVNRLHPLCFTLEDEHRDVKVMGETRIPAGVYKLGLQKNDTPMTLRYRKRYPWFKHHIEILNVPNFIGIYLHVGNTDEDSAGCVLVGLGSEMVNGIQSLTMSVLAFKKVYDELYDYLGAKKEVIYEIRDESFLGSV